MTRIQIRHEPDGEILAEGPRGLFGITSFEGNYYINRSCLKTQRFRTNWIPGFCVYKFLYVWLDYVDRNGRRDRMLGWRYVIPNPPFFFIFFRVAVPQDAPTINVHTLDSVPPLQTTRSASTAQLSRRDDRNLSSHSIELS